MCSSSLTVRQFHPSEANSTPFLTAFSYNSWGELHNFSLVCLEYSLLIGMGITATTWLRETLRFFFRLCARPLWSLLLFWMQPDWVWSGWIPLIKGCIRLILCDDSTIQHFRVKRATWWHELHQKMCASWIIDAMQRQDPDKCHKMGTDVQKSSQKAGLVKNEQTEDMKRWHQFDDSISYCPEVIFWHVIRNNLTPSLPGENCPRFWNDYSSTVKSMTAHTRNRF